MKQCSLLCSALQELRLLFDASGGGGRLDPIQLSALLQHLSRVAPAPELLTASERAELQGFALEVRGAARCFILAGFCTGSVVGFGRVLRWMLARTSSPRFGGGGGTKRLVGQARPSTTPTLAVFLLCFSLQMLCHAGPCCAGLLSLQLTAACMRKAHRMDAVGLANMISSALKLGCKQPLQQPLQQGGQQQHQQQHGQDDLGQKQGFVYADLLSAATKQVVSANGHAAGMLLSALTGLQQQLLPHDATHQQQQQQQLEVLQQQLVLWARFTAALSQRLRACAAMQQLPSADASRLCSTVSRLSGLLTRQRAAAAAGMPQQQQEPQQQQQQVAGAVLSAEEDASTASCLHDVESRVEGATLHDDSPFSPTAIHDSSSSISSSTMIELQELQHQYSHLQQQLRGLLSLAAQQVEQQQASPRGATAAPSSVADVSRVLYALAKTWVWPGWPAVLGLLQVYSQGVHAMHLATAAAAAAAEGQQGRGGGRGGGRQRKQQAQQQFATHAPKGIPALGFGAFVGGGGGRSAQAAIGDEQTDAAADVLTAARESLAPSLWAAGRLVEQQQHRRPRGQQQQQWLLQELQHHQQLWKSLGPVLTVCQQQLSWLGPLHLAQVAAGLGKVVASSRTLLQQAGAAAAAATDAGSGADAAPPMGLGDTVTTAGSSSAAASDLQAQLAGAAEGLAELLAAPELRRLLQQHMACVESLLPLLALQHRLQIAAAYGQLGQQVPQSVASVLARDQVTS